MIDSRYKEFFRTISVYHRTPTGQRPPVLAGFVFTNVRHHEDPFTRHLLAQFHQKEINKNASRKERPA